MPLSPIVLLKKCPEKGIFLCNMPLQIAIIILFNLCLVYI